MVYPVFMACFWAVAVLIPCIIAERLCTAAFIRWLFGLGSVVLRLVRTTEPDGQWAAEGDVVETNGARLKFVDRDVCLFHQNGLAGSGRVRWMLRGRLRRAAGEVRIEIRWPLVSPAFVLVWLAGFTILTVVGTAAMATSGNLRDAAVLAAVTLALWLALWVSLRTGRREARELAEQVLREVCGAAIASTGSSCATTPPVEDGQEPTES